MGAKGAGKATSEERVDPRGWRLGRQGSRKGPGTAGSGGDWEAGRRGAGAKRGLRGRGPAPPLTRFSSSSFSSGARVATATSTHRLLRRSSDTAAAPPLDRDVGRLNLLLAPSVVTLPLLWNLRCSYWLTLLLSFFLPRLGRQSVP